MSPLIQVTVIGREGLRPIPGEEGVWSDIVYCIPVVSPASTLWITRPACINVRTCTLMIALGVLCTWGRTMASGVAGVHCLCHKT